MGNKVCRIDVTNRDGVQTSRILLPKPSKTMPDVFPDVVATILTVSV